MSLLMEALKKAEEAKRQASEGGTPEPLRLEPVEADAALARESRPAVGPGPQIDELAARLGALDRQSPPPTTARHAEEQAASQDEAEKQREAAQNVFAVKQPRPATRLRFYAALGFATLIAAGAIAGYFWLQYPPASSLMVMSGGNQRAAGPLQAPAARPSPAPSPAPATIAEPPAPPSQPGAAPAKDDMPSAVEIPRTRPSAAPQQPAATAVVRPRRAPATATPGAAPISAAAPDQPGTRQAGGPEPAPPSIPIRVSTSRNSVDPDVAQGFERYNAGDLDGARAAYQRALRADTRNLDALRGLAAISLRTGDVDEAQRFHQRVLEAHPKDADAYAALINLERYSDLGQTESRLKTLIAAQPEAPRGYFALGNLYARQGRWAEAQQAYFRAHTVDSQNPDYQFNLAVSLEQLRQPRIALQYYQGALAAAETRPAAFDRALAAARVRELQR